MINLGEIFVEPLTHSSISGFDNIGYREIQDPFINTYCLSF